MESVSQLGNKYKQQMSIKTSVQIWKLNYSAMHGLHLKHCSVTDEWRTTLLSRDHTLQHKVVWMTHWYL